MKFYKSLWAQLEVVALNIAVKLDPQLLAFPTLLQLQLKGPIQLHVNDGQCEKFCCKKKLSLVRPMATLLTLGLNRNESKVIYH